ncbi:MAG: cobalamin biosynthesis protein CobG [Pseudomonadota bacterium]
MTPDRKTWGWCPSVWRPMPLDDGLLARLRPHLARLTAAQLRAVCDSAFRHGTGQIEITNRASLQIRGLTAASHAAFLDDMRAAGLLDPDLKTETRRSLQVTPTWTPDDLTFRVAGSFLTRLSDLPALPAKWGYVLDCGTAPCLQDTPGDIRIEQSTSGLILRADGAPTGCIVTEDTAWDTAIALGQWALAHITPDHRRMAQITAAHTLPDRFTGTPPLPAAPPTHSLHTLTLHAGPISAIELARAIDQSGARAVRLTPWRSMLLEGAQADVTLRTTETTP